MDRKIQYCQNDGSSHCIYRFSVITIKIPVNYFVNIDKLALKVKWRGKRPIITNVMLKEKNKVSELIPFNFFNLL
jgi:hypothetical protein